MQNKLTILFKLILIILLSGINDLVYCQSNSSDVQIRSVFDNLVLAYGSAKSAPQLIIISNRPGQIPPAKYYPDPKPAIKVDAFLFEICRTFGIDSLNALSIILSHELAHYYSDHTFCTDYAYVLKDHSKELSQILKTTSYEELISKETEADQKGLFFAAAAGYQPFEIQSALLDKVYLQYEYPDNLPGYPTKQQRKAIAQEAAERASRLYLTFKSGLVAMEAKDYDKAIAAFEEANSYIPFRENYNNLGVAKALKAIALKEADEIEKQFPNRFLYPFEVDNSSRLKNEITRGWDDNQDSITYFLKSAQKDLEKAISLDPGYIKGYINLACVFDLLGNPYSAIGKINELPVEQRTSAEVQRLLAIAYFHNNQEEKANEIWKELKM